MGRTLSLVSQTEGVENFHEATNSDKGVILLAPHMGHWELFALYLCNKLDATFMYQPTKQERIDGLINNAANNPKIEDKQKNAEWSRFENFSLENWEHDMAVGLRGAFLCSQVLGSKMAEQGKGVIINISSDFSIIFARYSLRG